MTDGQGTEAGHTGEESGAKRMAMFPLSTVLLPGAALPLHVFEPRYRAMVAEVLQSEPHEFGVVLIARGSEVGGGDTRTDMGTVARIESLSRSEDGRFAFVARGTKRLRVRRWLPDDPFPQAEVAMLADGAPPDVAALQAAAAAVLRLETLLSELGHPVTVDLEGADPGDDREWELCRRLPVGALDRQRLLEAADPARRLALVCDLAGALADDCTRLLAGG